MNTLIVIAITALALGVSVFGINCTLFILKPRSFSLFWQVPLVLLAFFACIAFCVFIPLGMLGDLSDHLHCPVGYGVASMAVWLVGSIAHAAKRFKR